jgi:uncharacterized LabA/DUF88 family protein
MDRVIVYIDGFNLYFGLKSKGWRKYLWLNLQLLARNLLKENQNLILTKYFTARVGSPPDKHKRQATYIEALETLPNLIIYYGRYQLNPLDCRNCGWHEEVPSEKMTDVNIAVEMLKDAFNNDFDVALLISADSDLVPLIKTIRELFPQKRVVVAFPPNRASKNLAKIANACFTISRSRIANSLFSEKVVKEDGYILERPASWR